MPTEIIPIADLPTAVPGAGDFVVGSQLGTARKFAVSSLDQPEAFLQTGTGAVQRTAQSKMREAVTPMDFGAVADGVVDDYVAIMAAFNSGASAVDLRGRAYRIGQGLSISGKTDFTLISNGAMLNINAAITGLTVSGNTNFRAIGLLNFTGLSSATGFNINGNTDSQFSGFRAKGLAIGGLLGTPAAKTFGGVSVPDQTRLDHFTAIGCGTGFRVDGEYYELVSPHITGCSGPGLHLRGGNVSGTGGTVNGNRIGVFVDGGVIGNSDHGRLAGMTINHNLAANVYVKNTQFAFHLVACDIWASIGDGTSNGQLTEEGRTTSFGVYLKNSDNIHLTGCTIARNRVNVGIDGLVTSVLSPNTFIADPARTTSHVKEYGASHDVFAKNAQNTYGPNTFDGALLGGATVRYELLAGSANTVANTVGRSVGTTGTNYCVADNSVTGTYEFFGDNGQLALVSNCPATIVVSAALAGQPFDVSFTSVAGGAKAITLTGVSVLASQTPGATIAGNVVTLKHSGLFHFVPVLNGYIIASTGATEPVVAPALTNSWAILGSSFEVPGYWRDAHGDVVLRGTLNVVGASTTSAFTLPAGYRPAAKVVIPIGCDAGKSGYVIIDVDGTVKPTYEAGTTFVSLTGMRFRALA